MLDTRAYAAYWHEQRGLQDFVHYFPSNVSRRVYTRLASRGAGAAQPTDHDSAGGAPEAAPEAAEPAGGAPQAAPEAAEPAGGAPEAAPEAAEPPGGAPEAAPEATEPARQRRRGGRQHAEPCRTGKAEAAWALDASVRAAVVQRMHARHGWHMEFITAWESEMERFLCLKAHVRDTAATILSPSGVQCTRRCRIACTGL